MRIEEDSKFLNKTQILRILFKEHLEFKINIPDYNDVSTKIKNTFIKTKNT